MRTEKFKPLNIADQMAEINKKNAPVNSLPTEHEALINQLTEEGKLAAVALMVNKGTSKEAKKTFLGTFEGITCEGIMNKISQRNRAK